MSSDVDDYKRALGIAIDALTMYAREDSYHAVAFLFDRPCGSFASDFSEVEGSPYERPMPGKRARETLEKLATTYPELNYISQFDE